MECLQHERVRIFQNKTSIERQSFMRICKLDAEYPGVVQYLREQFLIFAIAVLTSRTAC